MACKEVKKPKGSFGGKNLDNLMGKLIETG